MSDMHVRSILNRTERFSASHPILPNRMRHRHAFLAVLLSTSVSANNIQVSNATLTSTTSTTTNIQFDLNWENSWRTINVNNWDAAWVFVKYRASSTGQWQHVNLNNTAHVAATGSLIDLGLLNPGSAYDVTTNPVVGVFIYRDTEGTGNLSLPGVQLSWNYGVQGLNYADIAEVQVFAVEMVFVPQGTFAAGGIGTEFSHFTLTTINTGDALAAPSGTGSLGGQAGGYPTGQTAPTTAAWPNGYNAFYCMKYEISQQQQVDFLNTLTYAQQDSLTQLSAPPNSPAGTHALFTTGYSSRNGIEIQTPGVAGGVPAVYACELNNNGTYGEATDGKDIACNLMSWGDLMAYLDWSGLRPMTELEFEKACRGTVPAVADAYPWGTTDLATGAYTLANAGGSNEAIATNYSTTAGNATCNETDGAIDGPMRVGIFAAHGSNTGRVSAGATYYGIMEMGGNLWERTVYSGHAEGRSFTGLHGNGALATVGNADVTAWPAANPANGAHERGGAFFVSFNRLYTATRLGASGFNYARYGDYGGRGVRTAP